MCAAFDEMNGAGDGVRVPYQAVAEWLETQKLDDLKQKLVEAETLFRRTGITFAVYGSQDASERLIPFDIIPRILSAQEWRRLTGGIEQRVRALNAFMYDIYHRQEIIKAGKLPEELVISNSAFVPEMIGAEPPLGIYSHIIGIDIVRTSENDFFVLEDNTRTPSGVSYMLENRETMMHMFPDLFARNRVAPVENYPDYLLKTLESVAPKNLDREPTIALLTPGHYNSAYFEHSFLADQMGVELVEGQDLTVVDGGLHMKTTQGLRQVDVLYRRIDDDFIDPLVFRSDSVLGVPGLFDLYRAGRVTIVNAPGCGIADDKAIYSYIPEIIKFYTGQAPILQERADLQLPQQEGPRLRARQPAEARRQGGARLGRLRHADRADGLEGGDRVVPRQARGAARQLHRAADAGALDLPHAGRSGRRAAPPRPTPVRALRRSRAACPRRPHARRPEARIARRQLEPGRRHQRHLGPAGLNAREER